MAGDHQRRIEEILRKLSQSSPPAKKEALLPSDGIGKRKAELGIRVSAIEAVNRHCRPWDRGDLTRRLVTFKAMTWFGKPKAISAVNCARRGWINMEMDVISCEACGARLLFSTPSSWNLQQVEKAAAAFSLKLNDGHKMLCPWINNACDEKLALFPPTPPADLVDSYKGRSSLLLRLTALPIISSSAIDYMKIPQLEHFLSQLSCLPLTLNNCISLRDNPISKAPESASDGATASMYYQAQKIISLCGWEPSLLPYVVDSDSQPSESSRKILGERKNSPMIYISGSGEFEGGNSNQLSLVEQLYDPACTVLDCSFCGARVGLWAFATVQRPLESFIVVTNPNRQNESAARCADLVNGREISMAEISGNDYQNIGTTFAEASVGLKLTIAGGPPPTKQNFRPVVSFPIISRHLRAKFACNSAVQGCFSSELSGGNRENSDCHLQIDGLSQQQKDVGGCLAESAWSLKRKRSDNDFCASESNDISDPSRSKELLDVGNSFRAGEKCMGLSPESGNYGSQDVHSLRGGNDDVVNSEEITCGSNRSNTISERAEENVLHMERNVTNNVEAGETISPITDVIRDSKACENSTAANLGDVSNSYDNSFSQVHSLNTSGNSEYNHGNPSDVASCSTVDAAPTSNQITEAGKEVKISDFKNLDIAMANGQQTNGVGVMALPPTKREGKADHALGNIPKTPMHHKLSEFDPIRRHRPFCPWIASENGESLPGWRQTLNVLIQQEKEVSSSDSQHSDNLLPASMDKLDDPIVSIRKLFMTPATE